MALMFSNDAFGTDVNQAILAEVLGLLLWMLQTKFFQEILIGLITSLVLLQTSALACIGLDLATMDLGTNTSKLIVFTLVVNIVQYREIFDKLFYFG